jgi:hypothetical protein
VTGNSSEGITPGVLVGTTVFENKASKPILGMNCSSSYSWSSEILCVTVKRQMFVVQDYVLKTGVFRRGRSAFKVSVCLG